MAFAMDRLELLKSYLAKTPHDSFLNHALALEYIKLGRDTEAIKLFGDLLAREPEYVGSYYHLGAAQERTGDLSGALATYHKGIAVARQQAAEHALRELQQAADALED